MNKRARVVRSEWILMAMVGLLQLLWAPVSQAQTTSITSSGLNTQVSHGTGQPNYDITGGTRPGNGTNLFHSFGDFSVGTDQAARFLNDSGLATSNILSRVTGGHVSNIFGEINTTNFPGANLYLINPAGVLFGPTATLNVSGSVHVSTADYLRLADGLRFNAIPGPQDTLLSQAPVVAFGFLQAHPRPITVQGSQLSVAEGKGLSLVGGDVRITKGTLTAPGGQVNLVSLAGRGEARVSPEGITIAGWTSRGQIVIKGGTEPENVARLDTSGAVGGAIVLRGGKLSLVRAEFTTQAKVDNQTGGAIVVEATKSATFDTVGLRTGESNLDLSDPRASLNGGTVSLTAPTVRAANLTIDTSGNWDGLAGDVAINVRTLSASNLNLSNSGSHSSASANISIQASGPVTLRNSGIGSNEGFDSGGQNPGHITVRAATLMLERTRM
ncbi:MAG: filamentous hemagglutinin N-terminal domain-containing protein, partial [Nitrospira sp.]|nr:filamentous hemagglutinin N-terminal domain-containing protein [Nitrospira sp.]